MFLDIGMIYHNVVNIDEAKLANELPQGGIHQSMKSCHSVFQPKPKT